MKTARRDAFDPSQERDENGKWVSTGSGDKASEVKKAAGGGIHELKRDPNTGHTIATHSKGGRTSHMGTYSSPEKAKAAIAEHEAKVKERLRSTGANSAKVHNQVTEGMEQNRKERVERMASPVEGRWSGGAASRAAGARSEGDHSEGQLKHSAQAKEARQAGRKAEAAAHTEAAIAHSAAAAAMANKDPSAREKSAAARKASIRALESSRVAARAQPGAEPGAQFASAGRAAQIVKERQALANKRGFADFNGGRGVGKAPAPKKEHWFNRARREMGERQAEEQRLGPLGMAKKYGAEARLRNKK